MSEELDLPTPTIDKSPATPEEAVEITVFSFSKGDPDFDFAPKTDDELEAAAEDPKDSSAPEPASSSSSSTPAESESGANLEKTANAEKDSTAPASRAQDSGLLTF